MSDIQVPYEQGLFFSGQGFVWITGIFVFAGRKFHKTKTFFLIFNHIIKIRLSDSDASDIGIFGRKDALRAARRPVSGRSSRLPYEGDCRLWRVLERVRHFFSRHRPAAQRIDFHYNGFDIFVAIGFVQIIKNVFARNHIRVFRKTALALRRKISVERAVQIDAKRVAMGFFVALQIGAVFRAKRSGFHHKTVINKVPCDIERHKTRRSD